MLMALGETQLSQVKIKLSLNHIFIKQDSHGFTKNQKVKFTQHQPITEDPKVKHIKTILKQKLL